MRATALNYIAVLSLSGIGLAGCETIQAVSSPSLVDFAAQRSETAPELAAISTDEDQAVSRRWASLAPRPKPETGDAALLANIQPQILNTGRPLQCVPFARDASGIEIRGDAKNWWRLAAGKYARSRRPQEGSVFVMKGYQTSRRGHVAVVRQILDTRTIVVDHANWGNDGQIYLSAPVRDESPKNDWSQVRVWFTPADQLGRRIYRAKGFILPTTTLAGGSSAVMGPLSSRN
ncbi:MAG: CHAP domain-containing protein [Alphaproteobacteria bacterium]|nr:CHAP domain-containing protein [Alphaproteobacteria bacterium]